MNPPIFYYDYHLHVIVDKVEAGRLNGARQSGGEVKSREIGWFGRGG